MNRLCTLLMVVMIAMLVGACNVKVGQPWTTAECEGAFRILTFVKGDGKCYPKIVVTGSEGAVISRSDVNADPDTLEQNTYYAWINGSLSDPCTDAVVTYQIICGKDTVERKAIVKSIGFQATGTRHTTYNRQSGFFEYDLEIGCCPNAPAGDINVKVHGWKKIDFLKISHQKITCPTNGPQTIHVSGFAKDTAYSGVSVSFEGPNGSCDISTALR